MIKKLTYIANLRLPTEKAHSVQIMKMCEAFAQQGFEVELVVPDKKNNLNINEIFDYYGVEKNFNIRVLPATDFLGKSLRYGRIFYWIDFITFFFGLIFMVKPRSGTIIYTRDPLFLMPFSNFSYKLVSEIHSLPKKNGFFARSLKRSHVVVTITNYLKKFLVDDGIADNKIVTVPDAVDLKLFDINLSKEELRKELSLPLGVTLIGYVGALKTMNMEKGIDVALRALKLMKQEARLVLVGGHKADVAIYKELSKKIGLPEDKIIFVGRVSPTIVSRYLKAFDMLIAPFPENEHYNYYMSPLKLFEYMASGVPMVVSDLPSIREIVDESMTAFVKAGDEHSLSQTLDDLLMDPDKQKEMVDKASQTVQEYTWSKRAQKILDFVAGTNI